MVSRDGATYPRSGTLDATGAQLAVGNLPGTSTCSAIFIAIGEFEVTAAGVQGLAGWARGRCFGTVAGTFDLRRVTG
jgi:hypothetical protein